MVETALMLPLLLGLVLNVINFGYFFLVALNVTAATRSGALYSIQGGSTPASAQATFLGLPPAKSSNCPASYPNCGIGDLTYADMTGAIYSASTKASVQVCSTTVGITGSGTSAASKCTTLGSTPSYSFPAALSDPEKNASTPMYFLNQVDIAYQFTPLIPGTPFNIILLASPACTGTGSVTCVFHRQALMREMN
jgi:Flp pilus assembly protein TadG